jgi:3',5'-cyclic-AMP phosphodiesterase
MATDPIVPTLDPEGVVLARLARPRTDEPTRLGVLSDIHVSTRDRGTDRLFHRTEARLAAAISRLNDADSDCVVFAGDLTKDGEPWNFERFDALVDALEAPFITTPGNHDVPKSFNDHPPFSLERFYERYMPRGLPAVERVCGVDLLVLDSATIPDGSLFDSHRGAVSSSQREWLASTLSEATSPIVLAHHNVLPLVSEGLANVPPWETYTMHDFSGVADELAEAGASLALSGHHHVPAVIEHGSLTQVIAPATCAYPQAHLLVDIDSSGTTIRMKPHATPDEQREAYEALQTGRFRRTVSGIVADTIEAAPLVDDRARMTRQTPLD